jgi:hypothetical protein
MACQNPKYYLLAVELSVAMPDDQNFEDVQFDAVMAMKHHLRQLGVHVTGTKITTVGPSHEPITIEREAAGEVGD